MKFIHTSDIHYGIIPDPAKDWSKERESAVKSVLDRIIEICAEEKADLLLICGDMIHGQPALAELDDINDRFRTIPDTRVVIIAGQDDRLIPRSPVLTYRWANNVTYVSENELTSICFREINTTIYARSNCSDKPEENRVKRLPITDPSRINILMDYGGSAEEPLYDPKMLDNAGFSYAALGGDHKAAVIGSEGALSVYSGSPEPVCSRDTGVHGLYVCEIENSATKVCSTRFEAVSSVRYSTLVINVTPNTTNEELLSSLRPELIKRGRGNIYKLKLKGLCDPEATFNLRELSREFRISEITDETEPKFDYGKLFADHPSDIIGLFIQKLDRIDSSEIEKKALAYGVRALLKTSDEGKQDTI